MRVLLDTQAFISLSSSGLEEVSAKVKRVAADEELDLLLSSVSITEIAIKESIGKLAFGSDQIAQGVELLRLVTIPYTPAHAQRFFRLPSFADHRDPFDRMLIATALAEDVPIVTTDRQFRRYRGLRVLS